MKTFMQPPEVAAVSSASSDLNFPTSDCFVNMFTFTVMQALIGQRYGNQPLPRTIPAAHFDLIRQALAPAPQS